jgi:hypothetical protein
VDCSTGRSPAIGASRLKGRDCGIYSYKA